MTTDQLNALVTKVTKLQADKKADDDAAAAAVATGAAMAQAQAADATAKAAATAADAVVSADVADLKSFVDALVPSTPPAA